VMRAGVKGKLILPFGHVGRPVAAWIMFFFLANGCALAQDPSRITLYQAIVRRTEAR
jgi:hypothetical protein